MATKKKTKQLKITPPFGYGEVVLQQKTHRVLLPAPGSTPDFCRAINALSLSFSEFNLAARDYPIVSASADAGETYAHIHSLENFATLYERAVARARGQTAGTR